MTLMTLLLHAANVRDGMIEVLQHLYLPLTTISKVLKIFRMYNVEMVNPLQIFIIRLLSSYWKLFSNPELCTDVPNQLQQHLSQYLSCIVDDRSNQNPVLCHTRILNDRKNICREAEMPSNAPFTFLRCMSLVCAHQDRKFITVTLKRLLLLLKQWRQSYEISSEGCWLECSWWFIWQKYALQQPKPTYRA